MANDCLVTKLKGSVNNDNLHILGYNKYKFRMDGAGFGCGIRLTVDGKLILLDGTWNEGVGAGTRERSVAAFTGIFPNANTVTPDVEGQEYCTILIPRYTPYYYANLMAVSDDLPIELSGFKYADPALIPASVRVEFNNVIPSPIGSRTIADLSYAPMEKITYINIPGFKFAETVDLTQMGAGGVLEGFNMGNCKWNLTGSLDNLGKSDFTPGFLPDTKDVSIDLVNFVNNHRNAGRTTGNKDLRFLGLLTVKVNGVVIPLASKSNNILAWTADTITLDGEPLESYIPSN